MAKLKWDQDTERIYEKGVSDAVLYVVNPADGTYGNGEAWNGLINVTESPTGAEPQALYANNKKYLELMSNEEFAGSLEAYMAPAGFDACDGLGSVTDVPGLLISQQDRSKFGMVYKTDVGNDVNADLGYKLHLVYGALATPSEKSRQTEGETPEALTFSWDFTTTAVPVPNKKPSAHLVIDSRTVDAAKLAAFLLVVYGDDAIEPRLPLPEEVITLLTPAAG